MATLRHTRYQAAVVRSGSILLVRCAFRDGPTVWMLPGGGREDTEDEETCIVREVSEETCLDVRAHRLLFDRPAEPPDGTYRRWRTWLCTVIGGDVGPGGGEGDNAELIEAAWFPLGDEREWGDEIRADVYLYPQLCAIRDALVESMDQPDEPRAESLPPSEVG